MTGFMICDNYGGWVELKKLKGGSRQEVLSVWSFRAPD